MSTNDDWPQPTSQQPPLELLIEWHDDAAGCETTDGCWVEPDGTCPHGHPSISLTTWGAGGCG